MTLKAHEKKYGNNCLSFHFSSRRRSCCYSGKVHNRHLYEACQKHFNFFKSLMFDAKVFMKS